MIETNLQEKRNPMQIVWRVVFPGEEYMMSNTKKHPKILYYKYKFLNKNKTNGKYFANIKIHTLLTFPILSKNPILVLFFVTLLQSATNSCPDCDSILLFVISKNEATAGMCSLIGCTMQMSLIPAADNFPLFGPCNQDSIKVHKHFASFIRE